MVRLVGHDVVVTRRVQLKRSNTPHNPRPNRGKYGFRRLIITIITIIIISPRLGVCVWGWDSTWVPIIPPPITHTINDKTILWQRSSWYG